MSVPVFLKILKNMTIKKIALVTLVHFKLSHKDRYVYVDTIQAIRKKQVQSPHLSPF